MKYSNRLISTLLVSGGLLNLVTPTLADTIPTLAGETISNTAAATYADPSGNTINATSNPVIVTVAPVAGIDVAASGITNATTPGAPVVVGNQLYYNYVITNVGNIATTFHVPGNPAIVGPATLNTVEYSPDGGTTWTPVNPTLGTTTSSVPVNGSVMVRVLVTATNAGTNNNVIQVSLGNTPNNLPNQPYLASGNNDDVNTVGGSPANGQRESSATEKTSIGAIVKNIALATVTEKLTGVNNGGTPDILTDDVLTYQLGLSVAATDTTNQGITPAPLAGTAISLDGSTTNRILVSSAIPAGTVLSALPAAPTGWTAVYTTSPTATIANAATWTSTPPATPAALALVTRIGFVAAVNTTMAPGQSITGLTFSVKETTPASATSYTVNSIAQVFGSTNGTDPTLPANIIYDESGDATPNNYNPAVALSPGVSTLPSAAEANGVAVPANGIDTTNDNTAAFNATTNDGAINQYVYNYVAPTATSLLNGPLSVAGAVGPDGTTNSDFTDKSSTVPAGQSPTATFVPAPVGYFNTVQNTGTATANISLLPQTATLGSGDSALPVGTVVRIYTTGANSQSASYVVTATGFAYVATPTTPNVGTTASTPVTISSIATGATGNYQVEVTLGAAMPANAFPVAINAFTGGTVAASGANNDVAVTAPTATNKTIDKTYTGFMKMVKETQILQGAGPLPATADSTFSTAPKTPAQGNIIQYRITYTNIADKQVGTGNVVLNANNLVITEDGSSTSTTNTWGQDKDSNGVIDTSNVVTSAVGTQGTVTYFNGLTGTTGATDVSGTTPTTDVTKYINTLTAPVAPGDTGTFMFQRKLN